LNLGDEATVVIGIINHEDEDTTYILEVIIGGRKLVDMGPFTLEDEEKWENEVVLSPKVIGDYQKVRFLLYKNNEPEPYLELHFWIDVRPSDVVASPYPLSSLGITQNINLTRYVLRPGYMDTAPNQILSPIFLGP
jgi:hypothetical protein